MPSISNLKVWKNGEVFNARDYVYERNLIISQLNRVTALIGDSTGSSNANLTAATLTATTSLTLGNQTITSFADAGTKIHYETLPENAKVDDLFIDYD